MQAQTDRQLAETSPKVAAALILVPLFALCSIAALNGGVAPTGSGWGIVQTYLQSVVTSDYVLAVIFIAIVIGIWQVGRGKGWGVLEWIAGAMILAYILPQAVVAGATAIPTPERLTQMHAAKIQQPAVTAHGKTHP